LLFSVILRFQVYESPGQYTFGDGQPYLLQRLKLSGLELVRIADPEEPTPERAPRWEPALAERGDLAACGLNVYNSDRVTILAHFAGELHLLTGRLAQPFCILILNVDDLVVLYEDKFAPLIHTGQRTFFRASFHHMFDAAHLVTNGAGVGFGFGAGDPKHKYKH